MDTSKDRQAFVIETLLDEVKGLLKDITLRPFGVCLKPPKFNSVKNEAPGIATCDFRGIWNGKEIGLERNPREPFRFWGVNDRGRTVLVGVLVEQIGGSCFDALSFDYHEISVRELLEVVSYQEILSLLDLTVQEHQNKFRERLARVDRLGAAILAVKYNLVGG
jgi:hypothetical protein